MIDIHAHILPWIDDGALDMEESIEMAMMAAESGVRYMVATPHCNIPGMFDNYWDRRMDERFTALQQAVTEAAIPLQIMRGMEVFATPELPELLDENRVLTLNGSRYFLTEFAFDEDIRFCDWVLEECHNRGFVPVIAHPERYDGIQEDPEHVAEWIQRGYAVQVNKGSLLGRFGRSAKRAADILLQRRLATCIASDAHSAYQRTPHMAEVEEYLRYEYGAAYARALLIENPRRIVKDEVLTGGRER